MVVVLWQGVEIVLVKPRQVHSLFQGQAVPPKCPASLLISPDEQGAESLQHLRQGIKLIYFFQKPLINPFVIAEIQGIGCSFLSHSPVQKALFGSQIYHLNLEFPQTCHQIRVNLQKAAGSQVQKGTAAAILIHVLHPKVKLQRILF